MHNIVPTANSTAFYAVPSVELHKNGSEFKTRMNKRVLSKDEYNERSGLVSPANFFDSYVIRQLYRKESIAQLNAAMIKECATRALVNARSSRDSVGVSFDELTSKVSQVVCEALETPMAAVDTIYGDLYRVLLHGADGEEQLALQSHTLAGAALQRVMNHKSFPKMVSRVNGRETLAGVFAAKVHASLTDYVAGLFSEAFEAQEKGEVLYPPDMDTRTLRRLDEDSDALPYLNSGELDNLDDVANSVTGTKGRGDIEGRHSEDIQYAMECSDCIEELMKDNRRSSSIGELLDCFGSVDDAMAAAIKASKHGDGENIEIELGADIFKATPDEMMHLAIPELEMLFYTRMAEGQLLQVHRYGLEEGGKGPIVIMLDMSGSTCSHITFEGKTYQMITLFKAVAIALMKYAAKWHRPVAIIPFDTSVTKKYIVVHDPIKDRNGNSLKAKLLKLAACNPTGGTSWVPSLQGAGEYMSKLHAAAFDNADVIYLTDGGGELSPHFGAGVPYGGLGIADAKAKFSPSTSFYGLLLSTDYGNVQQKQIAETGLGYFFDEVVASHPDNLHSAIEELTVRLLLKSYYQYEGAEA